ncbi:hypothetical protein P7H70_10120 [Vagococcus carniphilus]|uniref:Uncharacterized protein n=1 Tax=Vagococcus carniphilus TaxID=218144 RepID=A0AAW8U6F5_9ENTE|nr:hypothetical protein [Vagococcus carniphilus]MDT2834391.1 hypothetical protein [Vagococcus carniphilus]
MKVNSMIVTAEGYEAKVITDLNGSNNVLKNTIAIELQDKEKTRVVMLLKNRECVSIPEEVRRELNR